MTLKDAEGNTERQIQHFIDEKVDLIIASLIESESITLLVIFLLKKGMTYYHKNMRIFP